MKAKAFYSLFFLQNLRKIVCKGRKYKFRLFLRVLRLSRLIEDFYKLTVAAGFNYFQLVYSFW